MADQPQAPVIIIRKKKKVAGGHHGGAWKVAYADFVTAMMSFFLLLWLLNVTTDIERRGIADYFAPASISRSESGAGGVFGGLSITVSKGGQMSASTPPSTQEVTIPTAGQGDEGEEDTMGKSKGENAAPKSENDTPAASSGGAATAGALSAEERSMVESMRGEEDGFKKAETMLKEAIEANPELHDFANQLVIDRTPEGLRIQIIDRDKFSMFPTGGSVPYERGRDLLLLVGKVIALLPNTISVTGHTDATPFQPGSSRDNWTLSTARANVSREYLVKAGVDEPRIARVSGLSDRDPFVPADPKDPRNRRISIVLLRKAITPPDVQAPQSSAPATPEAPKTGSAHP